MVFNLTVFLLGIAGGALAELLKWYQLRESTNLPVYARSVFYWIVTVLMVLAGGALALVHGVGATKPLLALNLGISAPLILKGLAASVPTQTPSGGPRDLAEPARESRPSVIDFIAGR